MGDAELDIGPLSWVKDEIALALGHCADLLERYEARQEAQLLADARMQLHQAHGALAIVGLEGVTEFSRAIERLLDAVAANEVPWSDAVGRSAREGIDALRRYLDDLIGGRPDQPLRLLPAYRHLNDARGERETVAADLFFPDLTQRPPKREEGVVLDEAGRAARLRAARLGFERGLAKWFASDADSGNAGIRDMRNSIAIIESLHEQPTARAFWWVTLAWFDALAAGGIADDATTRHLVERIGAQVKKLLDGAHAVAERLMRDVLYDVATTNAGSDLIDEVRAAYRLRELVPVPASAADPRDALLAAMRDPLAAMGEHWRQFCAGAAVALPRFHEQSALLVEQAQKLGHVDLARLTAALANGANLLRKNPLQHTEALADEVATALLLADKAIDRFASLDADFASQVDAITGRLNALQRGDSPPPHALPALRSLAMRAAAGNDLPRLGGELRQALQEVERLLDAYFRDPAHASPPPPESLERIGAMFDRLGQSRAAEVTRDCGQRIAAFSAAGYQRQPGEFEEVARRLSALGFFVEQLRHGAADLDALLAPPRPAAIAAPSVEDELSDMTRMTRTLVWALHDAPPGDQRTAALRDELRHNLENVRDSARIAAVDGIARQADAALDALAENAPAADIEAAMSTLAPPDAAPRDEETARLAEASAEEVDSELLAIFVEEVLQVLDTVGVQLYRSMANPESVEHLAVLRRCFHTLKGSSRMVGLLDFSEAARAVETTLGRHIRTGKGATPELHAMVDTAQHIVSDWVERLQRRASAPDTTPLLRQCESIRLQDEAPGEASAPPAAMSAPIAPPAAEQARPPAPVALPDGELLPVFLEECDELVPAAVAAFRDWRGGGTAESLQRLLHTLKGSARMAGAGDIGEAVHDIETRIAEAPSGPAVSALLDELEQLFDRVVARIDSLRAPRAASTAESGAPAPMQLRIGAEQVDTMVNEAGEIAVARSRIEGSVKSLRASLTDLTDNVSRLRGHLRELEIQAESRIQANARVRGEPSANAQFDPLEMDRFTRLQELTRILAESVNDVATVEHGLMRDLDQVDAALTQQARMSRELTQRLMAVRMVPFASIGERLRRVVRQTAQETGRKVEIVFEGAATELDRSVLERVTGPIEHLLRNAVVHGIEPPERRLDAGKPAQGEIRLRLRQGANELRIDVGDDGGGLDYERIRMAAVRRGLFAPEQRVGEAQLAQLIFQPGFTTAAHLSENAGRGIGMDVVRTETTTLGGHVDVEATPGRGTRFSLHLPLTLAVLPVVLVRAGARMLALAASMVVQASEIKAEAMAQLRAAGAIEWQGQRFVLHYLPRLFGDGAAQPRPQRRHWVLLLRGGAQHLAVEIDELVGNEEVVVKNIGPQLSRLPGIAGATVVGDGEVVLIVNPVMLPGAGEGAETAPGPAEPAREAGPPLVMVVDDSLTVRKVTGRLLERAGYRVAAAKDGIDALEQLAEATPVALLADIEMPRMDGFELLRRLRADARFKALPVVMITSRIADKHRDYAQELGADHYLGKPYDEEALLALIAGYAGK